jgi:hypothetical protein
MEYFSAVIQNEEPSRMAGNTVRDIRDGDFIATRVIASFFDEVFFTPFSEDATPEPRRL